MSKEWTKWKVHIYDIFLDFMVSAATENCQVMCEEVKKKLKGITSRDYPLV